MVGGITTLVFLLIGLSVLGSSKPLGALLLGMAVFRGVFVAQGLIALLSPDDEEDA